MRRNGMIYYQQFSRKDAVDEPATEGAGKMSKKVYLLKNGIEADALRATPYVKENELQHIIEKNPNLLLRESDIKEKNEIFLICPNRSLGFCSCLPEQDDAPNKVAPAASRDAVVSKIFFLEKKPISCPFKRIIFSKK